MTILEYITPSRLSGAERYFLSLIEHLREAGHRVIVVTKRDTPLRAEVEKLGVELHAWHTRGKVDPLTLSRLCRLIRRANVDVVHTHLSTAALLGTTAARLTQTPILAHVQATNTKTCFQWTPHLAAVSRGVKEHLMAQDVAGEGIHVVYNGIDLKRFDNALPIEAAKARLNLPPNAPTVGVVASLTERKGHRFLMWAVHELSVQFPDIQMLFVGEGNEEGTLKQLARALQLENRVHFLGYRTDIPQIIAACDVFALPSFKEGLSIAVTEALALRRAVIATDIAGMPEVIRDGETGLLVPPGDTPALQHALQTLLDDAALRQQLGDKGRAYLAEHFEQRACLSRCENLLQEIARVGFTGRVAAD